MGPTPGQRKASQVTALANSMTLRELSARTGVSSRNIRRYIELGLLEGPQGRSRAARYDLTHERRLQQITELLADGHLLEDIAKTSFPIADEAAKVINLALYPVVPGLTIQVDRSAMPASEQWVETLLRRIVVMVRRHAAERSRECIGGGDA